MGAILLFPPEVVRELSSDEGVMGAIFGGEDDGGEVLAVVNNSDDPDVVGNDVVSRLSIVSLSEVPGVDSGALEVAVVVIVEDSLGPVVVFVVVWFVEEKVAVSSSSIPDTPLHSSRASTQGSRQSAHSSDSSSNSLVVFITMHGNSCSEFCVRGFASIYSLP